jgi:hypothetical protein
VSLWSADFWKADFWGPQFWAIPDVTESYDDDAYSVSAFDVDSHALIGAVINSAVGLSGTAAGNIVENRIVDGGLTIILTLTDESWVTAGAIFNAQRQNIINGLTSAQSELLGWNNVVRDTEIVTSVVRTSDLVVTITLTAAPTYDITATEMITATIPATAVSGGIALVAPQLIIVDEPKGTTTGVTGRRPTTQKISVKSASFHVAGPETAFPVYQFSDRTFMERPTHNPFSGINFEDNFERSSPGPNWYSDPFTEAPDSIYEAFEFIDGTIRAQTEFNTGAAMHYAYQEGINADHFIECRIDRWTENAIDLQPAIWLWTRATTDINVLSGYFNYLYGDGSNWYVSHHTWAPGFVYAELNSVIIPHDATGIPPETTFRFECEGNDQRTYWDRQDGLGDVLLLTTTDSTYPTQKGMGIGSDSFPSNTALIGKVTLGNL